VHAVKSQPFRKKIFPIRAEEEMIPFQNWQVRRRQITPVPPVKERGEATRGETAFTQEKGLGGSSSRRAERGEGIGNSGSPESHNHLSPA